MRNRICARASVRALGFIALFAAAPVHAAALSFVSLKGTDAGTCAEPTTPCRSFAYALGQTTAGGEIRALDPGHYGAVTINKSITLSGATGAGIIFLSPANAINVNAGSGATVTLDGLTLNGFNKTARTGIRVNSAGRVVIRNCTIKNFSTFGILIAPTGATSYLIENTLLTNNGFAGVYIDTGSATGAATGDLNRVTIAGSSNGVVLGTRANARISDSMIAHNTLIGINVMAMPDVTFRITRSVVTQNDTGLIVDAVGNVSPLAETGHDNFIQGNGSNFDGLGTLQNVGTN